MEEKCIQIGKNYLIFSAKKPFKLEKIKLFAQSLPGLRWNAR